MNSNYKVLIFGGNGVGKSCFINRLKTGEFSPNLENSPVKLTFNTNYGVINFDCFEENKNTSEAENVDAIIYLFAVTQKKTFRDLIDDYDNFFVNLNKPVVYCGNKCDAEFRKDRLLSIKGWFYNGNKDYCQLSAKYNNNIERPFLLLARKLMNQCTLRIIESPPITPVEVVEYRTDTIN